MLESPELGRILVLDGILMLTEKDEFIYHEMIVHVPMAVHPGAARWLSAAATAARCASCASTMRWSIDLVEIDAKVVEVCREYFPPYAEPDPRVNVRYEDGLDVRRCSDPYDIIVVDSTDPFGPGEGLFTKEFYGNCFKALKEDGILVNQHENPFYPNDAAAVKRIHKQIVLSFPLSRLYQAHIPTYPSGHWLFGFSSRISRAASDATGGTRWE